MMYSKIAFGILFLFIVFVSDICAKCSSNEWRCLDGQCIEEDLLCDGNVDCRDQSDEMYKTCSNNKCQAFAFRCNYGACVGRFARCNSLIECADKSDESSCPGSTITSNIFQLGNGRCSSEEFECNNGECISSEKKCDGKRNCKDGSDETTDSCRFLNCPNFAYICDYGACVIRTAKCNNVIECADGSDETNCGNTPIIDIVQPQNTSTNDFGDVFKPVGGGCIIPVHPEFGNILNPSKTIRLTSGEIVRDFSQITYTCNRGYTAILPPTMTNLQNTCVSGQWLHPHIQCSKTCSSMNLDSYTTTATCILNNAQRNCLKEPILAGTTITITCKKGYKNYFLSDASRLIACKRDGTYTNNPWTCQEDCGKAEPSFEQFIIDGQATDIGKVPWHTAIYENRNGEYSQICGGTIISAKFVLSAAHCFWNPARKVIFDKANYQIAAGKTLRLYKAVEKSTTPQFFDLESINIPPQYDGNDKNQQHDIAVLKVTKTIEFDTTIRSACIEYNLRGNDLVFQSNEIMLVAGWGLTKPDGVASEQLKYIEIPTADANLCKRNTKKEFHPYITDDKFCAGHFTEPTAEYDEANSAGVCKGDSGGGLMYKKGDSYYVGGIVSSGPANNGRCDAQRYATFTNVLLYANVNNNYSPDFSIGSFLAR